MNYTSKKLQVSFPTVEEPIGFLDIETNGLCKHTSSIILIGLAIYENHVLTHHLWCIEDISEEMSILIACLEKLNTLSKVYTYNGTSFDLSFFQSKAEVYNLPFYLSSQLIHVDLKRHPLFKNLFQSKVSRKTLESKLHFTRTLQSTGRELAKSNTCYLQTGQPIYKTLMTTHHCEDMESLIHLYTFHRFITSLQDTPSIVPNFEQHQLIVDFSLLHAFSVDLYLELNFFTLIYEKSSLHLKLYFPSQKLTLKQPVSPKDYYIVKGSLMHHGLASFIPAEYKRKATKKEAFLQSHNDFVLHPEGKWYDEAGQTYMLYDDTLDVNSYIQILLKKIIQS